MMMSPRSLWTSLISSLIAGLVLAALVLLALFAWYVVMLAILQVSTWPPGHGGSVLPPQEVVSASALSTARLSGLGGLVA